MHTLGIYYKVSVSGQMLPELARQRYSKEENSFPFVSQQLLDLSDGHLFYRFLEQ